MNDPLSLVTRQFAISRIVYEYLTLAFLTAANWEKGGRRERGGGGGDDDDDELMLNVLRCHWTY